jgi:hypothetical protein
VISYVVRWHADPLASNADGQPVKSSKQNFHRSDVTDSRRMKKADDRPQSSLLLKLKRPLSITGDVCIELFNKPKMMKKVVYTSLVSYAWLKQG